MFLLFFDYLTRRLSLVTTWGISCSSTFTSKWLGELVKPCSMALFGIFIALICECSVMARPFSYRILLLSVLVTRLIRG